MQNWNRFMNSPKDIVSEALEGLVAAYPNFYQRIPGVNGLRLKNLPDTLPIVIGGGSGHEPMFWGFVGINLAHATAMGDVFVPPDSKTILEVTRAVNNGKGVLYIFGNYTADSMNFGMAAELAALEGIPVKIVSNNDDIASAPKSHQQDRRGIGGGVFAMKIAGAASALGYNLEELARVTQKAVYNTRSIGMALSSNTVPGERQMFTIGNNEVEYGVGIYGEPGMQKGRMRKADTMVDKLTATLLEDLPFLSGDEIGVLVNGLGATTQLELCVINKKLHEILAVHEIGVKYCDVNSFCTSQDMRGVSITLIKLDEELKRLLLLPAWSPYYSRRDDL